MKITIFTLIFIILFPIFTLTISEAFINFITNHYGEDIAKTLARQDLGRQGSYGGGNKRPNIKGYAYIY